MKDFIIYGTGDFADLVENCIINGMDRSVCAYCVDQQYLTETEYHGKPIVAFEEVEKYYSPEQYAMVIGFIGKNMYSQREEKFLAAKQKGYDMENVIHKSSILEGEYLGEGNIILQNVILAPKSVVHDNNVLCPKTYICHHVHVGSNNYFAPGGSTTGNVEVGNNCFIGVNSSINNKVKVADYTFVGGNLFISRNTKPNEMYLPQRSVAMKNLKSVNFNVFTPNR